MLNMICYRKQRGKKLAVSISASTNWAHRFRISSWRKRGVKMMAGKDVLQGTLADKEAAQEQQWSLRKA